MLSLHILRFNNEANMRFNLIKNTLTPFARSTKLCMWVPPSLSGN